MYKFNDVKVGKQFPFKKDLRLPEGSLSIGTDLSELTPSYFYERADELRGKYRDGSVVSNNLEHFREVNAFNCNVWESIGFAMQHLEAKVIDFSLLINIAEQNQYEFIEVILEGNRYPSSYIYYDAEKKVFHHSSYRLEDITYSPTSFSSRCELLSHLNNHHLREIVSYDLGESKDLRDVRTVAIAEYSNGDRLAVTVHINEISDVVPVPGIYPLLLNR